MLLRILLLLLIVPALKAQQVTSLDGPWSFTTGEQKGAEQTAFDATHWQTVQVPHDWAIAGPLDKAAPTGQGGGYFPSGIGWYRRALNLTPAQKSQQLYVAFDGVMANSEVWINGFKLGSRPNGTVSFYYDLSGHLDFTPGAKNILAVRTDTSKQPASRWYEGNGIYRDVRLVSLNNIHAAPWSTVVTTPAITADSATVHVETTLQNEADLLAKGVDVSFSIVGPDGKRLLKTADVHQLAPKAATKVGMDMMVPKPTLWNLDQPAMYTITVAVTQSGRAVDTTTIPFGIREFHFDANTGFYLNGKNFKLKGAAMHIDGSAVGIAVPDAVYEHRLVALKALGVNAIRTAHNPPSPAFLDLCDKLGLLVMDEMFDQWTVAKNPYDYHLNFQDWAIRDTRDTVLRDRNHPSVILWSAGNEIHDTPNAALANKILTALVKTFHENDPTRPVTQALFRPNASHDYDNGLADLLDVVGQNYREAELLAAHEAKPTRKIMGTENGPDRQIWLAMRDHPAYSGQFLWTGIDYLGEAGEAGGWPIFANGSGLLDRIAYPRSRGYERESWWLTTPNIHAARRVAAGEKLNVDPGYEAAPKRFQQSVYADWTPANTGSHDENVEVYTNCEEADLLLNGVSLGKQKLHADASPIAYKVPYAAGTLVAIGYNDGKEVSRNELRTAGKAVSVRLTAEHPTVSSAQSDLVFVTATLRDANGTVVPESGTQLSFAVTGPGTIVATDNANNADHDPFNAPARKTFQGRAVMLVRATATTGTITLTATSPGLTTGTTAVTAVAPATPTYQRTF